MNRQAMLVSDREQGLTLRGFAVRITSILDDIKEIFMISVKDGVVRMNLCDGVLATVFLGSTGPGTFPPVNQQYANFSFAVPPNAKGIIAFADQLGRFLTFYEYFWEKGKLIVRNGIREPSQPFSISTELGLVVPRSKGGHHVSGKLDGVNCYKSQLIKLLKYVEGSGLEPSGLTTCN